MKTIAIEELGPVVGKPEFLANYLTPRLKEVSGIVDGMKLAIREPSHNRDDYFRPDRGSTVLGCQDMVTVDGQTVYAGGE